jgi:predicted acyl esterase
MADQLGTSTEVREFGTERFEVLFRKVAPIDGPESRYPGFKPCAITLARGTAANPGALPLPCDIIFERDVKVPLRDGVAIYIDIFRPLGKYNLPVIVGWGPFGKQGSVLNLNDYPGRAGIPKDAVSDLQAWEAPDPAYWCDHGYAVVNPDPRGVYNSEGSIQFWGHAEARDGCDLIEWLASLEWCNGKVGLAGNSWLGILQWFIAAEQPSHLAAIAPWEGHIDLYRCDVLRGGIPDIAFCQEIISRLPGRNLIEDVPAMVGKYPLMNGYWKDKRAKLERIAVPAYVVASYFGHHTLDGYRLISSKEKWLRVHNTNEWYDFYTPRYTEDLRKFFDRYLKGINNGWEETPRVRLSIYDLGGVDQVDRPEKEWPLERTRYIKLYLDSETRAFSRDPLPKESQIRYNAEDDKDHVRFIFKFNEDTEITGYLKLLLWVEADGAEDMDLFVTLGKLDFQGNPVVGGTPPFSYAGSDGRLRVSHRQLDKELSTSWWPFHIHRSEELLKPGQIVPVEIPIRPTGMLWHAGEQLHITVAGHNPAPASPMARERPKTRNKGMHIIHTGGRYDSHLLAPKIP